MKVTLKTRHTVPQWLYENVGDIVKRVNDVEEFMHKTTWVANDIQVNCDATLFDLIKSDGKLKALCSYTTEGAIEDSEVWLRKKQWLRISRTLFVVEE